MRGIEEEKKKYIEWTRKEREKITGRKESKKKGGRNYKTEEEGRGKVERE